jgi:ankyrin repeat protein
VEEPTLSPEVVAIFERIREDSCLFMTVFDDVNATNLDGDNALHWAARANDLAAARILIGAGIEINQRGDLGHTPLHEACASASAEMILLLIENGADLYARAEGDIPFTVARLHGRDDICALLRPLMDKSHQADPQVYVRSQIKHLQREIERLEKLLQ